MNRIEDGERKKKKIEDGGNSLAKIINNKLSAVIFGMDMYLHTVAGHHSQWSTKIDQWAKSKPDWWFVP